MNEANHAMQIYEMLENDFECKNTEQGVLVTIKTVSGKEDVSIKSDRFYSIVANRFRKEYNAIISASKIKSCVLSYQGEVLETQPKVSNSNRCEKTDKDTIRIDIGNADDKYFEISPKGLHIKGNGYQYFYKHLRKGELSMPDMENGDIELIFKYCRIPENNRYVFIAYLTSLFIGNIEHPCLALIGKHGMGKTTLCTFIKALVDPVGKNIPMAFPSNLGDLPLMFQENYLLAFDNVDSLTSKMSDRLCQIITGITDGRRVLYTDSEVMYFDIRQPIILNGINKFITKPDLLSRSIVIDLEKATTSAPVYSDKVVLTEEFMKDRPKILGGIFNLLIKALRNYKPNAIGKMGKDIRMASFYDYGYYICEALGKGKGAEFCADYINLLEAQLKDFQKNLTLVVLVKDFLWEQDEDFWQGLMSELLKNLRDYVKETYAEADADDVEELLNCIPKTPNRLSRELNNLKAELEEAGIMMKRYSTPNNCNAIRLSLLED